MSRQPRLSDALIRAAISPGQNLAAPSGLLGSISDEVHRTSQDRGTFGLPAGARLGPRPAPAISRLAWALIAAALLTGLLVGSLLVGARRPDRAVVVAPSPSPTSADTTAPDAGTDILATTKAKPLAPQAACPPGSNPDVLGPADQERPSSRDPGGMAFDRRAGRIVLLADEWTIGSRTWTFDVCTNTWRRMSPPEEPPPTVSYRPVYDADSDRTLAFTSTGRFWSYDLAADRWTKQGWFPDARNNTLAYHDPSGLVVLYGGPMLAYDVDTDTLTQVHEGPDLSRPTLEDGGIAFGYDSGHRLVVAVVARTEDGPGETWTFDPDAGTWRLEGALAPSGLVGTWGWGWWPWPSRSAVFDEASGLTVFSPGTRVVAYDAGQRVWRTLYLHNEGSGADDTGCDSMAPVYDPLNARIVCRAGDGGVSAFSTTTGQWRWLLEPLPAASSAP